jgi:mannose-6-phosphate isomerase
MTFEHADVRTSPKPWGSHDLRPWSRCGNSETAIGEIRFDRPEIQARDPALLFKLLFTKQRLSIQVHPDDAFAQSMGMANGKTEAWYVLSAEDSGQVAIGLKRTLTQPELRGAIADGSIADLVKWQTVAAGDVFFIPAGTIHAMGPGLVMAEIQQRSDTTFRLFDYGRSRELHIDQAVAVVDLGPAKPDRTPTYLTVERMKLVSCDFFVLERIDLPPDGNWELQAQRETWALVTAGDATMGSLRAGVGDAFFAEADRAVINVGRSGLTVLLAYADSAPQPGLLRDLDDRKPDLSIRDLPQVGISSRKPASVSLRSMEGHL